MFFLVILIKYKEIYIKNDDGKIKTRKIFSRIYGFDDDENRAYDVIIHETILYVFKLDFKNS